MKRTEKQIKWAEQIKANINVVGAFADQKLNPMAAKAVAYINGIDEVSFWIDNKNNNANNLLQSLAKGKLRSKGNGYSNTAAMTPDGTITETWWVIVDDGKGGHRETKTKTI